MGLIIYKNGSYYKPTIKTHRSNLTNTNRWNITTTLKLPNKNPIKFSSSENRDEHQISCLQTIHFFNVSLFWDKPRVTPVFDENKKEKLERIWIGLVLNV